jgi:hypothetical protein
MDSIVSGRIPSSLGLFLKEITVLVVYFLSSYRVVAECKNFVFAGDLSAFGLPAALAAQAGTGRRSRQFSHFVLGDNPLAPTTPLPHPPPPYTTPFVPLY